MSVHEIPAIEKRDHINVVIETPKGSRNKYAYDPELEIMVLKHVLPEGNVFPFDFGFIPQTKGEDGDPLDVLVISDTPAVNGCLVECRVIGAILARQKEKGKSIRNDRILAIPVACETYKDVHSVKDLNKQQLEQIDHFFVSYNEVAGRTFSPLRHIGPHKALDLIKGAIDNKAAT